MEQSAAFPLTTEKDKLMRVHEVRDFSKRGDALPIPNLIDIQIESYQRFLQKEVEANKRKNDGLEALLREVFPIESYDQNLKLEYISYDLAEPRYTTDECRALRLTFGMPFRIQVRLIRKDKDEVMEEKIYLGDIPIMIGGGEFIINGAERVIVSQLHRSPGVDFVVDSAEGDRPLHACRIIPERGSWIEINVTRKDLLAVRIDQSAKIPATMFLRAMDPRFGSDGAIIREFYSTKIVKPGALKPDMYAVEDIFTTPDSAEPLVRAGTPIGDAIERIGQADIKQVEVIEKVTDPLILNTIAEDPSRSYEDALLKLYQRLRPGNPAQLDKAIKLFYEKFFDPNRYRLGNVGRFRINRKFGLSIPTTVHTLTALDFLACLRFLMDLRGQNLVGNSIIQRTPFELCLLDAVEQLSAVLKAHQLPDRTPKDPKTNIVLGELDNIRQGRRKLLPQDLVEELRRQLREINDTPTEWVPTESLNMPQLRKTMGRADSDRESDVSKSAKDFIVAMIRTQSERIMEGITAYIDHAARFDRESAQLDFMNYFRSGGKMYVFNEAEARRAGDARQSEIESRWKE